MMTSIGFFFNITNSIIRVTVRALSKKERKRTRKDATMPRQREKEEDKSNGEGSLRPSIAVN